MRALALLVAAVAGRTATLTISPPVVFDCEQGAAVATILWSGASGPVQVRLNAPDGIVVTGFGDPSGSVTTAGPWVMDGMQFFLVNQAGVVEATAVAHVSCGGTIRTIDAGLQGGSYFPLQVGNTWVYRINSRAATRYFATRSITRTEIINGKTYFVLEQSFPQGISSVIAKLRGDNSGVIWMQTPDGEQVYLSSGQKTSYSGPLGTFSDAITVGVTSLISSTSVYVRGIGLAHFESFDMGGSSGGFDQSLELVEVRMEGVRFAVPEPTIKVSVETTDWDVTDQVLPNCALPCYFAACGVGGFPPDPPGAYRPCTQAAVDAAADASAEVRLEIQDLKGEVVFTDSRTADPSGREVRYVKIPVSFAGGDYRVVGRVLEGGQEVASSNINVRVR